MDTTKAAAERKAAVIAGEALKKARIQAKRTEAEKAYEKFKHKKRTDKTVTFNSNNVSTVVVIVGMIAVGLAYIFTHK